jgi:hypothetical protein
VTLLHRELEQIGTLAARLPDSVAVDAPPRCDRCEASFSQTTPLGQLCPHEPKCAHDGWTLIDAAVPYCSGCDAVEWTERTAS